VFNIEKISDAISLGSLDLQAFQAQCGVIEKRELEGKGIEFLLKKMFPDNEPVLKYTQYRKPFLSSHDTHISITHSHDMLLIISNKKENTGVDVELIRDKVKNIQHKFLCREELDFAQNETEKLVILWAAKEAMYKTYGEKGIDFAKDMRVQSFKSNEANFYGELNAENSKKKYLLHKEKRGNYILVYTISEVR
jgi:4'-phosphopantetheinyl transferase